MNKLKPDHRSYGCNLCNCNISLKKKFSPILSLSRSILSLNWTGDTRLGLWIMEGASCPASCPGPYWCDNMLCISDNSCVELFWKAVKSFKWPETTTSNSKSVNVNWFFWSRLSNSPRVTVLVSGSDIVADKVLFFDSYLSQDCMPISLLRRN